MDGGIIIALSHQNGWTELDEILFKDRLIIWNNM